MIFSAGKKSITSHAIRFVVAAMLGFSGASVATAQIATPQKMDVSKPIAKLDQTALLRPSTLKDMSEGKADAPITLIEYASLTCGHCADFYLETVPELREKYVKTGKVHYIIRELALDPRSLAGSMLTRCVPEDKFFPFVQLLFEKQADWAFVPDAKTPLMRYAKMAGLSDAQFNACLTNKKMVENFQNAADQSMKDFGIRVTPTLFINGEKYEGALTMKELAPILDRMLAAKK